MSDYTTLSSFPESDREWTEEQWKYMIERRIWLKKVL